MIRLCPFHVLLLSSKIENRGKKAAADFTILWDHFSLSLVVSVEVVFDCQFE